MQTIENNKKQEDIKEKLKIFLQTSELEITENKEKRKAIIEEIANDIDARTCREALNTLVLTKDEKLSFEHILHSKKNDENGFAENFFYLFEKDPYYLSNRFKGGYVGIKYYMQSSFKFKNIEIPENIVNKLSELITTQTLSETITTDVMIEQHLFGDETPNLTLPFDYTVAEVPDDSHIFTF